jgi:molecular chaperone GrpE
MATPAASAAQNYQSTEDMVAAQSAMETGALARVQAQLAVLQAKNADLADQFLRAKADVENGRRRAEEEISKARKFAVESFAESLLPVADSLEAGLAIKDGTVEQIREGAQATLRQLNSALERNKVIAIDPAPGAKFDPAPAPGHQRRALGARGQCRGLGAAKRLSDLRAGAAPGAGHGGSAQIGPKPTFTQ